MSETTTCAVCEREPAQFVFHVRGIGGDVPLCSDKCADQFVEALTTTPGASAENGH